jgi:hypothetical protein
VCPEKKILSCLFRARIFFQIPGADYSMLVTCKWLCQWQFMSLKEFITGVITTMLSLATAEFNICRLLGIRLTSID